MAKKQAPAETPEDENVEASAPEVPEAPDAKKGVYKAAGAAFKSAFKKEDIRMGLMAFAGFGSFLANITGNARIKAAAALITSFATNDEMFEALWKIATGETA